MLYSAESNYGFVLGFFLAFVITCLIALIMKKKRGKINYDERQELARGKAYKSAFFVLLIYSCMNGLFNLFTGIEWCDKFSGDFIGICISVTVFACVCILNDAYFSMKEKPTFYLGLFSFIAIINIIIGMINLSEKEYIISDGQLNYHAMNLIIGIMFVIILTVAVIKLFTDKNNEKME